jgi:transcriptional regulator with XRE-family HTH domain
MSGHGAALEPHPDIALKVREELARRRLSRQALADQARVSLSTLEKALSGQRPFTPATVLRLEAALGISLRSAPAAGAPALAPDHMGAYARQAVRWIEGRYITLRPSFGAEDAVYSYITTVEWLEDGGYLAFTESGRLDSDFQQMGHVSMPHLSGHIYFVTNEAGQHRLMVLGRPNIDRTMFGILLTLQVGHGSQLVPVSCPVVLLHAERHTDLPLGLVEASSDAYRTCRALLDKAIGDDFARFRI